MNEDPLDDRKRALRRKMGHRCRSITQAHADEVGLLAMQALACEHEFQTAARIALFASLDDEPCTRPLFDRACQDEKQVLMPRMRADGGLDFCATLAWEELQPRRFGVLEPEPGAPRQGLEEVGIIVVPGVAFDADGHRLGRGRGFYDRGLPRAAASGPMVIGLAFAFQVVDRVPSGPLDRGVDALLTENGLRRIMKGELRAC